MRLRVCIRSLQFEFEGWAQLIELETLRNVLGVGFHLHFENNPLLGQIFGVDVSRRSQTMVRAVGG